jgi:uncharacterized protein with ATP-grasp and redox domains
MKSKPDCMVCLFQQALNTARVASSDPAVHARVLAHVAAYAATVALDQTPARLSKPARTTSKSAVRNRSFPCQLID